MLLSVANINAWRVNGPNLRLPEFTACPDYEGSTPSTVMSVISDWPSMQPFFHYASQEVVSTSPSRPRADLHVSTANIRITQRRSKGFRLIIPCFRFTVKIE